MNDDENQPSICPIYGANHHYAFATALSMNVKHLLTQQVMTIPTVVLLCPCGDLRHRRVGDIEPGPEARN